jgi:hypothetical protein
MTLRSAIITGTANININGTVGATTPNTGVFTTIGGTDTTDATSTTAAAVKTAGGLAVVKKIYVGDNIVIATSGKGIDFSATPGTGTSELFADYEEGTWAPSQGAGLIVVGAFTSSGTYTKVGRLVTLSGLLFGATSINTSAGGVMTENLPFTSGSQGTGTAVSAGLTSFVGTVLSGASMYSTGSLGASAYIFFSITYFV